MLPRATGRVALPQRAETDFYGEYTVFERSELSAYRFTARHLQSATCQGCNLCVRAATPSNFVQVERYFRARTGSTGAYGILVRYPLATSSLRLAALARGWEKQPHTRASKDSRRPTAMTNEPVVFDKFIHKELVDRVRAVEYAMNHRRQESCSRGGWNLFFL